MCATLVRLLGQSYLRHGLGTHHQEAPVVRPQRVLFSKGPGKKSKSRTRLRFSTGNTPKKNIGALTPQLISSDEEPVVQEDDCIVVEEEGVSEVDRPDETLFRNKWPVYTEEKDFPRDLCALAQVLMQGHKNHPLCESVLLRCDENYSFLIDLKKIAHTGDLSEDDTVKFKKPSTNKINMVMTQQGPKKDKQNEQVDFFLYTTYYQHKDSDGFKHHIYQIKYPDGQQHDVALIQYFWKGKKGKLIYTPH